MQPALLRVAASFTVVGALAVACLAALAADAPFKERRLALVIGNSAYPFAPLRNSINDAKDFAAALKDSGFDVTVLENASLRDTRLALRDFGDRLKQQGGVGLFYYAGHGMQVKGRNYLIPIAAQIEREDEVEFESLDANQVRRVDLNLQIATASEKVGSLGKINHAPRLPKTPTLSIRNTGNARHNARARI
jgi:hypothetical protein